MMGPRTLFLYIGMRFVFAIGAVFALCLVLIFMIDFVELLREAGKFGSVPVSELALMTVLRLPAYSELTLPFAALTGSIGALLMLSRSSELVIIRAAGMSVWQFLTPGVLVAVALGLFANYVYNPLGATARAEAERRYAEAFGREQNLLRTKNAGAWLRQDGADGSSVISAGATADQGLSLSDVSVLQFDHDGRFAERIDAASAELRDGYWDLKKAWVAQVGARPEFYEHYQISTYLSRTQVSDALGSVFSLSFTELPRVIELAERAGLSASRYRVQYEILISRPFLLGAMVLLGATVSLRAFRFGKVQTKVVIGLVAGFGFFILAEVSRQVGVSELVSPRVAAWAPVLLACFLSLTVLLHQEDG
ncbi:MAG: LPS export ABC transporter permease LptG [Hyphomicrobiaceae bacterium]